MGNVVQFRPKAKKGRVAPPPASAATLPNKPRERGPGSLVYRAIDGFPLHWTDGFGVVHACEASEVHPGITLVWTLCSKDVTDNAAYASNNLDEVTCPVCAKERWVERPADSTEPLWVPDYKPPANDDGLA